VKGLRPAFLLALVALGFLAWRGSERVRSAAWTTNDEPVHVRACRELRSGPGVVSNFEHPVLMKVIGAAGLGGAPARRPVDETRAARTFFPLLAGLLVVSTGAWAGLKAGPWAGIGVAAMLAAEPTLAGHGALVTSDVLVAVPLVLAALLLDLSDSGSRRGRLLLVAAGVVYGLALASKYSALPFLPVFAVAAFFRLRRPRRPVLLGRPSRRPGGKKKELPPSPASRPAARRTAILVLAAVVAPALASGWAVQETVMASTSRERLVKGIEEQFEGSDLAARAVWMGENLSKGLAGYGAGLLWVQASSVPGFRQNYFLGRVSGKGSLAYFPVALAVKLTTAAVALLAAALLGAAFLLAAARRGKEGAAASRALRRLHLASARSLLPGGLALAYLGAASLSDVNIGVRHVLPVVPLAFVAAAGLLAPLLAGRRRALIAVAAVLAVAASGEALAARGREIPFGNLLVGGPSGTHRVLSDSNVDWGQAQGALYERARKGDLGRTGVFAVAFDPSEGGPLGLVQSDSLSAPPVETAAVSVFILDVGRGLRTNDEGYPRVQWMKRWLVPLVEEIEQRAVSSERLGDEYVLFRLRPAGASAFPAPAR
jgi:hypothetical protein